MSKLKRHLCGWLVTMVLSMSPLAGCEMHSSERQEVDEKTVVPEGDSVNELSKYIRIPVGLAATHFEVMTLPESGASEIPAPTDYAALVVRLTFRSPEDMRSSVVNLRSKVSEDFPSNFLRGWMSKREQATFKALITKSATPEVFDIDGWSTRKVVYAAAKPADERTLLLFVCLLAP